MFQTRAPGTDFFGTTKNYSFKPAAWFWVSLGSKLANGDFRFTPKCSRLSGRFRGMIFFC